MIAPRHIYLSVAIAGLLIALAIVYHAYIGSVRSTAEADAVRKLVAEQTAELRAELKASLAAIEADKRETQTPQQIVVKIPEYVPNLPAAPQLVPATPAPSSDGQVLPEAPSALLFPQEDIKPLFDRLADCKACEVKLAAAQKENTLLERRTEAAEKAMKGGGFWRRLKSNSKWFVVGGAVGAAAMAAAR